MRSLLVTTLFFSSLISSELKDVKTQLEMNSPILKAKFEEIKGANEELGIQTKYKNPKLTIGANDLLLSSNNFFKRDIEPMQNQYIGISQEFDTFGKLDIKESIYNKKVSILQFQLEDLRNKLLNQLRAINVQIKANENIKSLLGGKLENLQKLNDYYQNITSSAENITSSVQTEQNIYTTSQRIFEINNQIENLHHQYEYILGNSYDSFNDEIKESFEKEKIKSSPLYKLYEQKLAISKDNIDLSKKEKLSNVTLSASYNQRENFNDYLNVSLSFALPIYDRENKQIALYSHKLSEERYNLDDYLKKTNMEFDNYLSQLKSIKNSEEKIKSLLVKYDDLITYSQENINSISNIAKAIISENSKIDLDIENIKLRTSKNLALLQIDYLTKESER